MPASLLYWYFRSVGVTGETALMTSQNCGSELTQLNSGKHTENTFSFTEIHQRKIQKWSFEEVNMVRFLSNIEKGNKEEGWGESRDEEKVDKEAGM